MRFLRIERVWMAIGLLGLGVLACASFSQPPANLEETVQVTQENTIAAPPTPTDTVVPPPATPNLLPIQTAKPGTVVLDFVALVCNAKWTNNSYEIPCPGNPADASKGYIQSGGNPVAEGDIPVYFPVLAGLPGQGGLNGLGLFGRYPALKIQDGDTFKAMMACQEPNPCEVEFALEYYDVQGNYHDEMNWKWRHKYGGGVFPVTVDLTPLAEQTVELVLVVRDEGQSQEDWVLWIYPYVERSGN